LLIRSCQQNVTNVIEVQNTETQYPTVFNALFSSD